MIKVTMTLQELKIFNTYDSKDYATWRSFLNLTNDPNILLNITHPKYLQEFTLRYSHAKKRYELSMYGSKSSLIFPTLDEVIHKLEYDGFPPK